MSRQCQQSDDVAPRVSGSNSGGGDAAPGRRRRPGRTYCPCARTTARRECSAAAGVRLHEFDARAGGAYARDASAFPAGKGQHPAGARRWYVVRRQTRPRQARQTARQRLRLRAGPTAAKRRRGRRALSRRLGTGRPFSPARVGRITPACALTCASPSASQLESGSCPRRGSPTGEDGRPRAGRTGARRGGAVQPRPECSVGNA